MAKQTTPPWKKKNPNKKSKPLSSGQKAAAKARAEKAGRPYPNLDRKSTRLNSSHSQQSRMPSSA